MNKNSMTDLDKEKLILPHLRIILFMDKDEISALPTLEGSHVYRKKQHVTFRPQRGRTHNGVIVRSAKADYLSVLN